MKIQEVIIENGRCIEVPNNSISIMDFPESLRLNAAAQFIYTALSKGNNNLSMNQLSCMYRLISSLNIESYLIPVFKNKDENARFLLALELSNVLAINGINLPQEYIYSKLFAN